MSQNKEPHSPVEPLEFIFRFLMSVLEAGCKFYVQSTQRPQKGHPVLESVMTKSPRAWLLLSEWEGLSSLGYTENKRMAEKKSISGALP